MSEFNDAIELVCEELIGNSIWLDEDQNESTPGVLKQSK